MSKFLFYGEPPIMLFSFLKKILFSTTEEEFHEEFEKLLDVLGVKSPFYLVIQVWTLVEDKLLDWFLSWKIFWFKRFQ